MSLLSGVADVGDLFPVFNEFGRPLSCPQQSKSTLASLESDGSRYAYAKDRPSHRQLSRPQRPALCVVTRSTVVGLSVSKSYRIWVRLGLDRYDTLYEVCGPWSSAVHDTSFLLLVVSRSHRSHGDAKQESGRRSWLGQVVDNAPCCKLNTTIRAILSMPEGMT